MRIAWLGGAHDGGGVPGMGALLLGGVLNSGVEVDYFTYDHVPPRLESHPKLRAFRSPPNWQWNRWYSRKAYLTFFSSMIAHSRAHKRLCMMLLEQHRQRPYDVIFQFSLTELFTLGRHLKELPPVVIYPCTHAGGELRWHRRESAYARQSESSGVHYLVRMYLMFRSWVQRRETQKPAFILGMSRRFNELTSEDYGISPSRQGVLYHPIATAGAALSPARPIEGRKVTLLFVGRISVRKGIEQIIELSKRLDDLADHVAIKVVGEKTLWSDYRAHLKQLNPRTAEWLGGMDHEKTMSQYDNADILLVPSMYEPGGLVVGEALSRGLCVVASDEVGSAEIVDEECCRHFPAGDIDAFERTTRKLIQDVQNDQRRLRELAAAEAERHFSQAKVAGELIEFLRSVSNASASTVRASHMSVG